MRTPTARTSMGGLALLALLAAVCAGAEAADRGRGRHIRRITAADLPPTPGNASNSTAEEPITNQPGQLIVTEVFNKSSSKDLSSPAKQLDAEEKPSATSSKDLDDTNRTNRTNQISTEEITKSSVEADNGPQTTAGVVDSEKPVDGSTERSSPVSVPREVNVTRGNVTFNTSTELVVDEDNRPEATSTNATVTSSGSDEPTKPKEEAADSVDEATRPKVVNATEVLHTSSSTYRRRRPVETNSTSAASNRSLEVTEAPPKSSKEVNINEVVSNRSSSRRLRKPVLLIKKNGVVVANHTLPETGASKNCTEEDGCEPSGEAKHGNSTVSNSSADENSRENSIETTTTAKPAESPSVRPTDGAFNNIDFSSTARMVLQEKIHEDILHHLPTVSYAHYETDYVMDDDADAFDAESSKNASTVSFGQYDAGVESSNRFAVSATTQSVDTFDETFARISEGIQHNLDEIEERSAEGHEESFGGSSAAGGGVPKNDSRVSLEYSNKVDVVANNSAHGNDKRGDLTVANATHVDFERSFVETKVMPEVVSTVKYLIDDEYSTTQIIPANEESKKDSNNIKDATDRDQLLEGAEDDAVIANPSKSEETSTPATSQGSNLTSTEHTNLKQSNQTLNKFKAQGRGRMFSSERLHANNSNNVDQAVPEGTETKRLRARGSQEVNASSESSEETVSPRSRSYMLRGTSPVYPGTEHSSLASRRISTLGAPDALGPTSPRNSFVSTGRPVSRYPPFRQGVTGQAYSFPAPTSPRVNLLRVGQPSSRYPNNSYAQEIPITSPDPTTTKNLLRVVRPSSRYTLQANNSYAQDTTITGPDVAEPTSPRNNLIRASNRHPPQDNNTRQAVGTKNDEGNDIPPNNTPPTRSRGETRFAGVSASSLTNEEYPIPPTAAAWSLVTMKEPSVRTGFSPSTTLQLVDNNDSDPPTLGGLNKLTTVHSSLTPTASMDTTVSGVETTTLRSFVTSTEPVVQTSSAGGLQYTTEDPSEGVTTQLPEFTTINTIENEESDTSLPGDLISSNSSAAEDGELRFDIGTTVPSELEAAASTTLQSAVDRDTADETVSTTLAPETTRAPKEDSDKTFEEEDPDVLITTTETSGLLGFGFADTGMSDDGQHDVVADPKEGEEEGVAGQQVVSDDKEDGGALNQGETDYGGPTGPDAGGEADSAGGSSTAAPTSPPLDDASSASEEGLLDVTTPPAETTPASNDVTTTVESVTSEYPSNTSAPGGAALNDEAGTNVTTPTHDVTDAYTPPARNVPSFLRVFVEASPRQFCETVGMFKKAVADLLTKGSGRMVSSDQVVLRNFGREQCSLPDDQDNSTSATGLLLPVELHLVDEAVNFDRQLNEAFTLIWGQEGMDFPLRILKVDVVATQDEFMTSSVDKAGVIAAIAISCIGAVCLLLLTVLLIVMRKRQKKFNYGMRCTPVSLDAYSLDSVSIHDSVRRKAGLRASKRSYGNPAFDDPSAPSHPLNFAGLSAFSTERGAMEDEFARIPHVTPKSDEQPPGSETKNRYANVLPLPETRVVLASNPQEQLGDYINANYVAGPKNAANFYIACQAPLLSTVTDFWRMIWEQQSKVIMMLTELVENGVEKCADYLPPSEVLDCHRLFGDFQVTLKKREVREKYVISTLQLKNLESNSWREITHLWYVSWPSQGVPEEPNSMIAFLIEARSYMKNRSGPSVVHCSPGTGRTGTVLACDLSIREFEHSRQVDIPRCVARLRRDRAGCVQTRDQYAFIYQVLNLYATKLTGGALDSI